MIYLLLIEKSLHGLKTRRRKFHKLLDRTLTLRKMGLACTRHDINVWNKPRNDVYENVATNVSNSMVAAKESVD